MAISIAMLRIVNATVMQMQTASTASTICNCRSTMLVADLHRGGNLPTIDDIEYDANKLRTMTEQQLIYQMLCRKDLERPKRPQQLEAVALQTRVITAVEAMITQMKDQQFDFFANKLTELLSEYTTGVAPDGS